PAVDGSISGSGVRGDAMPKAMKTVTGSLKQELAQYRSMEAIAVFASDLTGTSKAQLARGERIMELYKQVHYAQFRDEHQVVSLLAATYGKLDAVPVTDITRFESEFLDYLKRSQQQILDGIRESDTFDEDTASALSDAYDEFAKQFETGEGGSIQAGH